MSNFPYAIEEPLKSEGGYANDPKDPGGETYRGISRKAYPDWEGWAILDRVPNKKYNQVFPELESAVKTFYFNEKWVKFNLDKVTDKDIAAAALDTVIQHGKGASLIQQALQRLGHPVTVDGRIGPDTVAHLNKTPPKDFLASLYDVREGYYKGLVRTNPDLVKFLPGWMKRISPMKGAAAGGMLVGLAALATGVWYYLKQKKIVS